MSAFAELTVYIITMAFTPGPNVILCMVNAAQKGFPKCLELNIGMFFGGLLVHSAVYFMISFLVQWLPALRLYLQILGIIYILYLAWCMFRKGEIKVSEQSGDFKTGFMFQFMNVKVMMLGVTVNSVYILPLGLSLAKGYLLIPYLCVICLVSTFTWAVAGAALSKLYSKHRTVFNVIFGLSLLALAIRNIIALLSGSV
ncbi:MAG: LysE family transporter [Sphaerochaetaceae bacterium]|nr:LysE family transporter [Sphaerochaetaceae bacterium]